MIGGLVALFVLYASLILPLRSLCLLLLVILGVIWSPFLPTQSDKVFLGPIALSALGGGILLALVHLGTAFSLAVSACTCIESGSLPVSRTFDVQEKC